MNHLTLPTKLTISRIVVVPILIILLINPTPLSCFIAALVFGAGAITDGLDGYLARATGTVTPLGKLLDPIADKILMISVLIPMVAAGRIPGWLAAIMLAREFSVTGVRMMAMVEKHVIPANWKGKYKMGFEIAAMEFILLQWDLEIIHFQTIGMLCLMIALFYSLWGAADYFRAYWKTIAS